MWCHQKRSYSPFMQWYIERAAAAGASESEVLEAVKVGIETGGPGYPIFRGPRTGIALHFTHG